MITKLSLTAGLLAIALPCAAQINHPDAIIPINTPQDLQDINKDLTGNYSLETDLDLSNFSLMVLGSLGKPFLGSFNGNNHVIKNLNFNLANTGNVGLFASIGAEGSVSNLFIQDALVTGRTNVGILAGNNSGVITNVDVTGTVNGYLNVGGLVGTNVDGTIDYAHASATIKSTNDFAGILVGGNSGTIKNSSAIGSIDAVHSSHVGGLVGDNGEEGTISNSYAEGMVRGEDNVGGLTGGNYTGQLLNDFANVAVNASGDFVGGLSGDNVGSGKIINSYALGKVSAPPDDVGGLVGYSEGQVINSYWDLDTTGQNQSAGGIGKSDAFMQVENTYQNWDFVNVWQMHTYPILRNVP